MKEKLIGLLINCYKTLKDIDSISIVDSSKDIVTEGDIALGTLIRKECLNWNIPICIYTEEFPDGLKNCENPQYYIFVDELDGTDNAYRSLSLFPSTTLIQIARANKVEDIKFEDFIAVGAVEHSKGEIYIALKGCGIERYNIVSGIKQESTNVMKHPKQEVVITDMYSMMSEPEILETIVSRVQTKDFGASAATYCYVSAGLFEGYVSSHKKGHELPLLYLLCKEAGLQMTDFSGNDYDKVNYKFKSKHYQVIAGLPSVCKKLINILKLYAKKM